MKSDLLSLLQKYLRTLAPILSRHKGLLLRGLLCWLLGLAFLANDERGNYDQRFELRGNQAPSPQVVLITLRQADVASTYFPRTQFTEDYDQLTDLTDSFFWNQAIWSQLLQNILAQNPRSVGVSLYFGNNIGPVTLTPQEQKIFLDPRLIWSSSSNYLEEEMAPVFMNRDQTNVASNAITRDDDGIVRRAFPSEGRHLAEKLTQKSWSATQSGTILNYRGDQSAFLHYSAGEILLEDLPADALKDKIILIGAETGEGQSFLTPMGTLTRLEVIAQMTDQLIENRNIRRLPFWSYALVLALFTVLAVYLMTRHPQKVVLMFFIWIITLSMALSVWTFDAFYIWMPALSPAVILFITWVLFIGHQATKIEQMHFQLQQEQRVLLELEQLKNNFVSLISHDLKTPIAKIQAIVDRLILDHPGETNLGQDLKSLRGCSEELNKYIQSILQLLRLESRDFHLNKEVADINEIIEEVVQQVQTLAAEKRIQLITELEPMFSLEFDTTLLKEVVLNLVENAIKYTPAQGKVTIRSEEIDNVVRVSVQDTGEGIKPEDLERVWGKFTRGSDQDLKSKGTGLGLYLVKYFIELHKGSVQMESTLHQGTTVTFTLPLEEETADQSPDSNIGATT